MKIRSIFVAGSCAIAALPALGGCASLRPQLEALLASASSPATAVSSRYGAGDPKLAAPNPTGGPINPFLSNGRAVLRALDAIAARSGRPLRLTNLQADEFSGLTAEVQEPKNHVAIDEYKIAIDGTLTGPLPVRVSGANGGRVTAADVDAEAFDARAYRFAGLDGAIRQAIVRSKTPDARASSWQVDRAWGEYQWGVTMDAARSRPNLTLKRDASIASIQY